MAALNRNAVKLALPALFEAMADPKWQTKQAATLFLGHLASSAPEQISVYLPDIVPVVTDCMVDLKPSVREAATDALTKCCAAIGNRDIEPFVPHLIRCIGAPGEVPDCVHKLSATTFVQSVDARTLSILVPLLVRGLTDRTTPIRRKACVIIRNMAKLVDDPVDAATFVSTLLPNVKYAMEGMSNPEARDVATDCHKILESINTSVEAAPKADAEELLAALNKAAEAAGAAIKGDGAPDAARYVAGIAANLVDTKNFEEAEWTQVRCGGGAAPGPVGGAALRAAAGFCPGMPALGSPSPLLHPAHPSPPPTHPAPPHAGRGSVPGPLHGRGGRRRPVQGVPRRLLPGGAGAPDGGGGGGGG